MTYAPLKNIRVLDCSTLIPGPYCTMMMAEMGAEVIKVERAVTGDGMRVAIPGCFDYLNGNKSFVTLNLKDKKGLSLFMKIAEQVDVIVEGFRPGIAKRLGIDFDSVKKINPSIIYCAISGYGQSGPYTNMPSHDINFQGLAGLLSISGNPDAEPEFPDGFQVADLSASMFALASILAALNGKASRIETETPDPVYLDISISETMAMLMMPRYFEYTSRNNPPKSNFMGRGPYGVFETQDKKYITIGVVENNFWLNLCNVLGFDDLTSDKSLNTWLSRNQAREKIVPRLKEAIKKQDSEYWLKVFTEADVPVAPINDFENWMDNPQFKYRKFFPGTADKKTFRRFPVDNLIFDDTNESVKAELGKDNIKILSKLGLSKEEIDILKKEKTI
ncbi:MAG: CoA transferase [Deltaproteobacteria bacterium]|nr:CoA transferase [Deltaproteobacteria bacterium]